MATTSDAKLPQEAAPEETTRPPAGLSPVEMELEQLARGLSESAVEPEELGACVFEAGSTALCGITTRAQCEMLGGVWFAAGSCPNEHTPEAAHAESDGPVAQALAELGQKLAATRAENAPEIGACVYAAGSRACRANMTELQCELLGGVWFREEEASGDSGNP